uniref:Uncharacterized protein n=1 Tax=Trichuris muris TaxID=70415 RepID=A0A5S6QLZ9_TRIMR
MDHAFAHYGIHFIEDGNVFVMSGAEYVTVIHEIIPANVTWEVDEQFPNARTKRLVGVLGLLGGIVATGLGLKNMVDIAHLQADMNRIYDRQNQLETFVRSSAHNYRLIEENTNRILVSWSTFYNSTAAFLQEHGCQIKITQEALVKRVRVTGYIEQRLRLLKVYNQRALRLDEIREMVPYGAIPHTLGARATAIPSESDIYRLVQYIRGKGATSVRSN